MGKVKYRYNPKTCKYEPYYLRGKALQERVAVFIGLSLVLGVVFYFIYTRNFNSLEEQLLTKKNLTLKVEWQILEDRIQAARYGGAARDAHPADAATLNMALSEAGQPVPGNLARRDNRASSNQRWEPIGKRTVVGANP